LMVVPYCLPCLRLASIYTERQYNEMLYIIEGVDSQGRRFSGVYNKEDADYLLASDCLNRLVKIISQCDTINS
jgi:hypothetical protein